MIYNGLERLQLLKFQLTSDPEKMSDLLQELMSSSLYHKMHYLSNAQSFFSLKNIDAYTVWGKFQPCHLGIGRFSWNGKTFSSALS
jgi:hypothetical protein